MEIYNFECYYLRGLSPSLPDILYSLTGEWKGWCDSLGNQNEKQKDEDFKKV
jgi:hypothetical protein